DLVIIRSLTMDDPPPPQLPSVCSLLTTISAYDYDEKIEPMCASTFTIDIEAADDDAVRERIPMNQEHFDNQFAHKPSTSEVKRRLRKMGRKYTHPFSSCRSFGRTLLGLFPIISWLPKYSIKTAGLPDMLGGLTMGVMNVPQGIAYAALAGVPAESGLYTAFLPPLIYMIFGTTRHNSIGCFSVVSLMCGLAVERFTDPTNPKYEATVGDLDPNNLPTPEQVASSLTMLASFVTLLMGILRLDFLTTYLSDQVVAGFTTAASVHVLISQIPDIIGITIVKHDGQNGYLVLNTWEIIKRIPQVNLYTCGISVLSITFLLIGKEVITPLLQRRCNYPYTIPYELMLVIVTTLCSYFFHLDQDPFDVKIVGNITTGIPIPAIPRFDLMQSLIPDAITITLVVYAIHISLAKIFGKKMDYEIDANQELLALGLTSVGSSFFPIYPVACSLSHSLLNVKLGVKTLMSNIYASAVVLATILFLATYLEPLPKPVLNVIIIVALMGIFGKFAELPMLWRVSTIDFSIWVVSFLSTVFIDITPGLIVSVFYALFTTIAREQWPRWRLIANIQGTLDFEDSERYGDASFFRGICMFRLDSPLLFTNVEHFKRSAFKAVSQWDQMCEVADPSNEKLHGIIEGLKEVEGEERHFIIDCSGFTFVDFMGVTALKEVFLEMHKDGVLVYFAAAKAPVRDLFAQCGYHNEVPKENFYPTIRDAVAIAKMRQEKVRRQTVGHYSLDHHRISEVVFENVS
ncbi:hypothetical protein PENTCL1PPCAC_21592, partial [Pristionchus entomophagus]